MVLDFFLRYNKEISLQVLRGDNLKRLEADGLSISLSIWRIPQKEFF